METGQTVILLNLENLYESLYDALNQVCVCVCVCLVTSHISNDVLLTDIAHFTIHYRY